MPTDSWGVGSSYVINISDIQHGTFGWDVVGTYYVKLDNNLQYGGPLEDPFGVEIDRDTRFPYGWQQEISCGPAAPPDYNLSWCCPPGYYTPDCIDFDECSVDNGGCDEHSKCTNLAGDFSCGACAWGWNGTRCTNLTDGVEHKVTKRMGNSSKFATGYFDRLFAGLWHDNTFDCVDSTGWMADGCINVDDCYSGPCQNGGVCIDEVDAYQCVCPPPYVGEWCHLYAHGARAETACHCGNSSSGAVVCECQIDSLRNMWPKSALWFEPPYDDPTGARKADGTPVRILDTPRVRFWNTSGLSLVKVGNYLQGIDVNLNWTLDYTGESANVTARDLFELPAQTGPDECELDTPSPSKIDLEALLAAEPQSDTRAASGGGFVDGFTVSFEVVPMYDVSNVTCGQPANFATACPDNQRDCAFVLEGTCSDPSALTEVQCLALGSCQTAPPPTLWEGSRCDHLGASASCTGTATIASCADPFDEMCGSVGMIRCLDACVPNNSPPPDCAGTFDKAPDSLRRSCPDGCTHSAGISTFVECSDPSGISQCIPRSACCSTEGRMCSSTRDEPVCLNNLGVIRSGACQDHYLARVPCEVDAQEVCEVDLNITVRSACAPNETWVSDNAVWTWDTQGECVAVSTRAAYPLSRVSGCTDSTALNFDARAGVDDGSCKPILQVYRPYVLGLLITTQIQDEFLASPEECAMTCEATGPYDISGNCKSFCWRPVAATAGLGLCALYAVTSKGLVTTARAGYHMPTSVMHRYYERGVLGCTDPAADNYDESYTVQPPWAPHGCDFNLPEPEPGVSLVVPEPEPEPAPPALGDCGGSSFTAQIDFYVADIDDCGSNPCRNGGTCTDHVDSYSCVCAAGYNGDSCQNDDDDCAGNPCQNNGVCTDGRFSYTCACRYGFTGANCSICVGHHWKIAITPDATRTDTSWDLRNLATNRIMIRGVARTPIGYGGTDFCENSTSYRFTLKDSSGDGMNPPGAWAVYADGYLQASSATDPSIYGFWSRKVYDIDVNDCIPNPVSPEAGLCARPYEGGQSICYDGIGTYECRCNPGYEHAVRSTCTESAAQACADAGSDKAVCVTIGVPFNSTLPGSCIFSDDVCTGRYTSACASADLHPRFNQSTQEGNCHRAGPCRYDKGRPYCEKETDECGSIPCQNGGTCTDLLNNYTCDCIVGFDGYNCNVDIDDCAEYPCQNNGRCVDGIDSYVCECVSTPTTHFEGELCENEFMSADFVLAGFVVCCLPLALCLNSCRATWVEKGSCIGGASRLAHPRHPPFGSV